MNRLRFIRLLSVLIGFLLTLSSCQPPRPIAESRPYSVGYNFRVHADSLLLQEDRPMHWCQGVAQTSDSLWVYRDNHLVVAAIIIIPEDCVDSVWVKVARDQGTMGWTHESDLLESASPDDPISQFIRIFSSHHLLYFAAFVAVAVFALVIRSHRRRHLSLPLRSDIPSAYPTLLTSALALSTALYTDIQFYRPEQWVQFFFHPTLNPLVQPSVLCIFLCLVWALLLLTVAVANAAFSYLRAAEATVYLLALMALCIIIYLLLTAASHLHIFLTYFLSVAYILLAFIHYFLHVRAHYLCGRCGAKLRDKGTCPRCGAIND